MHRARNEFYVVPAPYCYWTRGEPVWMVTVVCGLIPTSEFASRISIAEDCRRFSSRMSSAMLVRDRHSNSGER
jgi:hypothetical protein